MFTVVNHRLHRDGQPVAFRQTPNLSGTMRPQILVMHYTGSSSAEGAISWLANPQAKASAHLVIGADGAVTQLVPFNRKAWHAGASAYPRDGQVAALRGKSNCNDFSIGIELVNPGQLGRGGAGGYVERLSGKAVPPERVLLARHRNGGGEQPWAMYDPRQIDAAVGVGQALAIAYKLSDIVGHDDIAPGRKTDPGPAFPLASYETRVMGRR